METSVRYLIYVEHPTKGLVPSVFTRAKFLTKEEAEAHIPGLVKRLTERGEKDLLPMKVVKSTLTLELA